MILTANNIEFFPSAFPALSASAALAHNSTQDSVK